MFAIQYNWNSLGSLCIGGLADTKSSGIHHCGHLDLCISSYLFSLYLEDPTCRTTSSERTVSLCSALKVTM